MSDRPQQIPNDSYDQSGGEAGWVITALEDRVKRLEDLARWRKWPEEKPEHDGDYLIYDGNVWVQCWIKAEGGWTSKWRGLTHWLPIVPPPPR